MVKLYSNVYKSAQKLLLLIYFNKNQKNYPIEKEVYYKSTAAPFTECFNQTFLDIWN